MEMGDSRYLSPIPALQIDLNLFGMGQIRLSKVLFRTPLPSRARPHRPGWSDQAVEPEYEEEGWAGISAAPLGSGQLPSGGAGTAPASMAAPSPGGNALPFIWTERSTPTHFVWSKSTLHPKCVCCWADVIVPACARVTLNFPSSHLNLSRSFLQAPQGAPELLPAGGGWAGGGCPQPAGGGWRGRHEGGGADGRQAVGRR